MWKMTFFFQKWEGVREFFSQGEVPKQTVKKSSRTFWHLPQLKHGPTQLNHGPKAWTRHRRMHVKGTLPIRKLLTKKNHCEMCYFTWAVFIVRLLEKTTCFITLFSVFCIWKQIKFTGKKFFVYYLHTQKTRQEDILYYLPLFY